MRNLGLIELLDLESCKATIDAVGCQTEIADKIIEKKANYHLAVKEVFIFQEF